jgi:hypothetical protein
MIDLTETEIASALAACRAVEIDTCGVSCRAAHDGSTLAAGTGDSAATARARSTVRRRREREDDVETMTEIMQAARALVDRS